VVLVLFPYFHTWTGFGWFLDNLQEHTGINLSVFEVATFGVWVVILLGLNLLTGYSGQISLGHGALVAVGAYITAILLDRTGTPVAVAILAGGLGAGLVGFGIGVPALRLTGPYLAIATLALIVCLPQVLKLSDLSFGALQIDIAQYTNSASGLDLPTMRAPGAVDGLIDDRQWLYYSTMLPAVIMTLLAWNITRSRIGRAFIAIRDSEIGAQQMGVNVAWYKTLAFGLSSLYAGVGGGLFVYTQDFVSPESFGTFQSITILVAIVIGGLASILGSILAAAFFVFQAGVISELADNLPAVDRLRWAIYGAALILVMVFLPTGAAGATQRLGQIRPRDMLKNWRSAIRSPSDAIRAHPLVRRISGKPEADADRRPGPGA
jgi:branched-chain amino acid transport system permease protein